MSNFSMLDHIDKLTSVKGGKYICPACNGTNFSVDKITGAYNCYDGCESRNVREAVAPWENRDQTQPNPKAARPAQKRQWTYTDVEGNPCIQVSRADDGNGKKQIYQAFWESNQWIPKASDETKAKLKKSVTIYRYAEILKAIAAGQVIFWVEGEPCADLLWDLGLPATTSIGGSMAYKSNGDYSQVLKGASVVICPDRDVNGLKYANLVAADYPEAKWLYAFPDSPAWENPPKDKGLDIADWVADLNLDAPQIMGLVEDRRKASGHESKATPGNGGFDVSVSLEVQRIVDAELPHDEELAEVQDLAKSSGFSSNDIKCRVKALKMAREAADDRQKAAQALPSLIAERNRRLDLRDFLWGDGGALASMFHRRAQEMKMPVEHSFTAFIPTSANFIPSGVETLVQEGFEQPLIFNAMILGATGDGKSHALKVAIAAAELIERIEREKYAILKQAFDSDLERWNDSAKSERGEKPQKPIERRRIYQNGTRESLMRLHATNPQGLLWAKDEGEGFAASQNQYRSGKGDDVQQGLEDFNGGSYGKDLATDNTSYFIPHRKIQKLGTMHVAQLMKQLEADDFADYRGDLARWLLCAVPFGERKLDLERSNSPKINRVLTQALKDLYEGLETLEPNPNGYLFDDEAYTLYAAYQHQLRDWCHAEVGSLAAAFPKMEQYCIRLAGWLHIINAKLGGVKPDPSIDSRTMVAAIELTDFYIGQLRLIYASAVPGQALTGLMFEVHQFCQAKAKPLTAGSIRTLSRTLKAKADTATMKQLLAQLVKSGYGQMEGDRYTAFSDPVEPEFVQEYTYVEGD